jgi:pyruvate dehydrogenase E1 component
MVVGPVIHPSDVDELEEIWEWIESFDAVVESGKPGVASRILQEIRNRALAAGVIVPFTANTPYVNTIPVSQQPILPGDHEKSKA